MIQRLLTTAAAWPLCRNGVLAAAVVSVIALPQIVSAFDDGSGRIVVAEQTPDPKKKGKAPTTTTTPPPVKKGPTTTTTTPPPVKKGPTTTTTTPPPVKKGPGATTTTTPPVIKKGPATTTTPVPTGKGPGLAIDPLKKGPTGTGAPTFGKPKALPGPTYGNVKDLRDKRKQIKDKSGRIIIVEPDRRRIIREGKRVVILRDDSIRMRRWGNARFETRGTERYTIVRRGGYEIVTVTDINGRLLRRFRRGPDGREYVLIDNRRRGIGIGIGAAAVGIVALGLLAPRITIPRERYIVDAGSAPPTLLYEALEAPPVAPLERAYTLDEIRDNVELRDHVRSIDVNTINFSSGSWEVSEDQIPQLQALAEAMLKVIGENPDTVFLIEGHTDAVGSAEDNLSLSDRRAEAVAEILTTHFQVPPENIVTQGYGEQHLRVQTDGPSRENRRVQVRNITGLLAGGQGGPPGDKPPG